MKRFLFVALLATGFGMTQAHAQAPAARQQATKAAQASAAAPQAASSLSVDNVKFQKDAHDFGTVAEGPSAEHIFQFTNTGKEPVIIQKVQPSCGCTTPDWTKEPVLPGKTGIVKASYGTQGRPGQFTKTLTVISNAGTKVLTISGNVEKAPTNSVPENGSMMRMN